MNLVDPLGLITLQDAANFAAGFGDALSFGLTSAINDATGASSVVDPCSGAFAAGEASGFGLGLALGAAGIAKAAGGGLARAGAGSVDDLLKGASKTKAGKSTQFDKSGSANKAFDRLARGSKVKDQGGGVRSTTLSDGSTASVRPSSTGGNPTVQVNPSGGGRPIKVRFSDK